MAEPQKKIHVGLVGAGLGGLTAAIAIARAGAKVTVLEAAAELGEIGAGIQMTPNVSRFLIRWGVSDIIGDDLVQCDSVNMRRSSDGKIVAYTDFKRTVRDYGFPWWVVHRHHLHTGLAESARRHGCNLVIDARVNSIDHSSNPIKVTTEKGAKYDFDLLIGSDGLKSVVRKVLFPDVKPRPPTKNAAYRGVIPYEEVFAKVPEARSVLSNNIDVWGSPGGYCITYPISAGRDLNLVLSHHRDNFVTDVEEVDMNELRDFYKDYDPTIKKIIDLIPSSLRWPLLVTGPLDSWSNDSKTVVLLGDACNSMQNHLAQGAATSMESGAFLGRVISEVIRGVITMPEAITIYEKTRMPRVWTKQQSAFTAGEIYMAGGKDAEDRNASSEPEISSSLRNVTSREPPPPTYRSWNIWGYPDTIPSVYTYDAEGDADNAVCEFLQNQGDVNPNTRVAKRLRDKWWSWSADHGKQTAAIIAEKAKL